MRRWAAGLIACCGLTSACSEPGDGGEPGEPERVHDATAAVIYGEDDRIEAVEEADPMIRERALRSTVALVRNVDSWRFCNTNDTAWSAQSLGERENLCDSEPFRDQPVLASCSGTLIDRDLVVTAQHCVGTDEACRGTRFVMGLYLEPDGDVRRIPRADIYSCKERVVAPSDRDITIVRLDRPVEGPFEPAPVATAPFAIGEPLVVSGFPTGIPMKIAKSCSILDYRATDDGYLANCDLFGGNSGSGFFDLEGNLLGVYYQGAGDYKPAPDDDCYIRLALEEEGTLPGVPTPQLGAFTPARYAVELMCAQGTASPLCGIAPVCGDGECQDETPFTCAADCPAPACGDSVCDPGEDYDCTNDCGARDQAVECGTAGGGGEGGGGGGADGHDDDGVLPRDDHGCNTTGGNPAAGLAAITIALWCTRRRRPERKRR